MLDLDDAIQPVRLLVWLGRAVWWLVWDFGCELVAWSIGWPTCRVLSAGRFPSAGFRDVEDADGWEEIVVILVGYAVIAGIAYLFLR